MKYVAFALAALAITACDAQLSDVEVDNSDGLRVHYFQDTRTDMCYAMIGSRAVFEGSASGIGMANVECTEEVLRLTK